MVEKAWIELAALQLNRCECQDDSAMNDQVCLDLIHKGKYRATQEKKKTEMGIASFVEIITAEITLQRLVHNEILLAVGLGLSRE